MLDFWDKQNDPLLILGDTKGTSPTLVVKMDQQLNPREALIKECAAKISKDFLDLIFIADEVNSESIDDAWSKLSVKYSNDTQFIEILKELSQK